MNKFIFFATVFFTGLLTAQVSESRTVGTFTKLKVSAGVDVLYTISDKTSITVETDDAEKMKLVKTEVENGTLVLSIDTKDYKAKKSKGKKKNKNISFINGVRFEVLKITVSGPNLQAVKASSSADVKFVNTNKSSSLEVVVSSSGSVSGSFDCSDLLIEASSSGDFAGTITAVTVDIKASSSGDVVLKGKAKNLIVKASSSSDCELKNLAVEKATIEASSSADVEVTVTASVDAKASSSADVVIYGNPVNVSKEVSSSGSVSLR